jgi:hypothetical protein
MRPNDVPAVQHRLREQNYRDKTSYSLPKIFDESGQRLPSIVLALVAVDVKTGMVVQGHIWERTVEQMSFGTDPRATVCSMHEYPAVFHLLREKGYSDLHILVPTQRVKQMEHGLDSILGMTDTGEMLRHFYRLLDPAENDALRNWYEGAKR